ncbi:hypothetical protein RHSIM_Rhsim10G0212200 [Rhododendron simsii]|uniref:Chalcone-flavanone isomerase family protein n=1 Tax=Rhododendron simsii TaxID=118357 RepID=A0A834G9R9_RHOSS|nr:hypothetical protein RHSIM_Rhsim10G0212200 [Rhododendron simsii]
METPSSTRRFTRSQILATSNSNTINNGIPMSRKNGESEKGNSKSRPRTGNQQDRSALIDISNDSPIVGLAIGRLVETPLSETSKMRNSKQAKDPIKTPGSGEALLRGQVKSLLQKVEEEAELSKLSSEHKPFSHLKGCFVNSPTGLLAPTPANTHLVLNLSDNAGFKNSCLALVTPSPVQEQLMTSQMVTELLEGTEQEGPVCENSSITRSLLLDFTEKLEGPDPSGCSSVLTNIGGESEGKEKSSRMEEEDADSIWSVQVNASSKDDEDSNEEIEEDDDYAEEEEEGDDGGFVDELCEWMSNISVCEGKLIPKFSGKHTRFVYNRDDEIEGEEVSGGGAESEASFAVSTGIVRLKGLPTPEGKHFRFPEEEEQEDN